MKKKRSKGIMVLGVIFLLIGIWGIAKLAIHIFLPGGFQLASTLLSNIQLLVLPILQTSFLVLCFGTFKRSTWTPIVAVTLCSLQGLCYIYWLPLMIKATKQFEGVSFKALAFDVLPMLIIIGFQAYIIYYFTRFKVKEHFRR